MTVMVAKGSKRQPKWQEHWDCVLDLWQVGQEVVQLQPGDEQSVDHHGDNDNDGGDQGEYGSY